jgi:hypothetical protein
MKPQEIQLDIQQEVRLERRFKDWLLAVSEELARLCPDLEPQAREWQARLKTGWNAFDEDARPSRTYDDELVDALREWDAHKGRAARELRSLARQGKAEAILDVLEARIARGKHDPENPFNIAGGEEIALPHPVQLNDTARAPSDAGSHHVGRALARLEDWQKNEEEATRYSEHKGSTLIYQPSEIVTENWFSAREHVLDALDKRFKEIRGDLVADVIDILFHHWFVNRPPRDGAVNITLGQILAYRKKEVETKELQIHFDAMRDARALRLRDALFDNEPLLHLSALRRELFDVDGSPGAGLLYRYTPGHFLAAFLKTDNFFIAPYARKVWELDPYRDSIAKRLARYLRGEWRMNPEGYIKGTNNRRYRTWAAHFKDAGIELPYPDDPARAIKTVEKQIEKLYYCDALAECGRAIYHPDDLSTLDNLPRRGKLPAFLSLRVHLAPAADVSDALKETAVRRFAHRQQQRALAEKAAAKPRKRSKSAR